MCPALEIDYLWIDTCCIDKTNSVELQEALNSMFRWYAGAEICLAFLYDVDSLDGHPKVVQESFRSSEWFRRGWTLQELVASKCILFYNGDWDIIGSKWPNAKLPWMSTRAFGLRSINAPIAKITGIPEKVLGDFDKYIGVYNFEQRRSWMKGRLTTRREDAVYCQLGIFGVFMPLIYGEGDHAMVRLEEAIEAKQRRVLDQAATGGGMYANARPPPSEVKPNSSAGEKFFGSRAPGRGTPLPVPTELIFTTMLNGPTRDGKSIEFTVFFEAEGLGMKRTQVVLDRSLTVEDLQETARHRLRLDERHIWRSQLADRQSTMVEWLYPGEKLSDLDPKIPIRIVICE